MSQKSKLQAACDLIEALSHADKIQALRWLAACLDAVPGIERTPGVCGGEACVASTRIPVWVLVRARQLGGSEAEILEDYPRLSRDDLDAAWGYYALHRADIEQLIESNESSRTPVLPR